MFLSNAWNSAKTMEFSCVRCDGELEEPGGIYLSPPFGPYQLVKKMHLCVDCCEWLEDLLLEEHSVDLDQIQKPSPSRFQPNLPGHYG